MTYAKLADFFLTGLVVVWPVLLWSGNYEPAVATFGLLLFGVFCCGLLKRDGKESEL